MKQSNVFLNLISFYRAYGDKKADEEENETT